MPCPSCRWAAVDEPFSLHSMWRDREIEGEREKERKRERARERERGRENEKEGE